MSHTIRLKRVPDTFRQLTGITPWAFDRLLAELEPRDQQADAARETHRTRQRKPGAGRQFALPLADRLLMLLMYYRTDTTRALLGFLSPRTSSSADCPSGCGSWSSAPPTSGPTSDTTTPGTCSASSKRSRSGPCKAAHAGARSGCEGVGRAPGSAAAPRQSLGRERPPGRRPATGRAPRRSGGCRRVGSPPGGENIASCCLGVSWRSPRRLPRTPRGWQRNLRCLQRKIRCLPRTFRCHQRRIRCLQRNLRWPQRAIRCLQRMIR